MKLGHQPLLTKKRLNCKTLLRIASVYCCNLSDHKKLLFEHSYNDPGTLVLVCSGEFTRIFRHFFQANIAKSKLYTKAKFLDENYMCRLRFFLISI